MYAAYLCGDRPAVERILSDDFTLYSPADAGIDRARYFERCWPNSGSIADFQLTRLIEDGDEVVVTYAREPTGAASATPRCSRSPATSSHGRRSTSGWNLP